VDSNKKNGSEAMYELVRLFDEYCNDNDIDYFAMEDTLVGAVTYGDFIPDAETAKLGILRKPFERLKKFAKPGTALKRSDSGYAIYLDYRFDNIARYFIRCEKPGEWKTAPDSVSARLQVFDGVTDDYNLTTFQRFREKTWADIRNKAPKPLRPAIEHHIDAIASMYDDKPHEEIGMMMARRRRLLPRAHFEHPLRIPFGAGFICIPNDTRCWVESDPAAEADRIKRVQHDSLEILREVDRVCKKNGIDYFLCAGSLLGQIRYHGFIPWDDDIDLGMLREDYDRFIECAGRELGDRFFLQHRTTDPDVEYLFAKVRMKDTEYVTDWTRYRTQEKGISLDIFPFDRAPVESPEFEEHARKAQELVLANRDVARHRVTEDYPNRKARTPMEAFGHAMMKRRSKPYDSARLAKTQAAYEAHVTKYNNDPDADYAVSYVAYLTYLPLKDLLPYREAEFEGELFPIPNNPDPLMSMQFGDYMSEPPEHQRHGHRVIAWRTSDGHCG